MPVNKDARFRFEVLDECLRNEKKKWTKTELLNYVNRRLELHYGADAVISRSQLRYDLESMETEFKAPIEMYKDGRSYYYRYEDPSFSIRNIPIEEMDLQRLAGAVQLLQQIHGFTIAEEVAQIVQRLESRYKFSGADGTTVIAFETSPQMQGVENLDDIYQAILNRTPLKITYQAFKAKEARLWIVHPYLLKEHAHRWYLLGYCEQKGNVGIYALDRMQEIRVAKAEYVPNRFINGNEYFRDVIGVTLFTHNAVETVELLFSGEMAPYVQTKPLHHSQEVLQQFEDGSLKIQLRVHINPELTTLLLSYGHHLKVLQPTVLVQAVKETVHAMLNQYEG